jgi:2-polyprenyl-3-methyl-5-hydroxy-6-metoxy-1,4-benzoquinol methylase
VWAVKQTESREFGRTARFRRDVRGQSRDLGVMKERLSCRAGGLTQQPGTLGGQLSERFSSRTDGDVLECPVCDYGKPGFWASVGKYVYLRCRGCGLVYLKRTPPASDLGSYYNTDFQVDRKRQEKRVAGQCHPMLRVLEQLLPGRGRLLEIGCSYGHFLSMAEADGWVVEGVEISRSAAVWARQNLGLRVHSGTLEEVSPELKRPFDAVVMFHVLEHAPQPERLVLQAREFLRPGGILVIRTPNASSWIAKRCGTTWEWLTPPAHIYLFSPVSLQILLEGAGFRAESISTQRGDAHNTAFELARGVSKRILGHRGLASVAERPLPSRRSWYRDIEALSDVIYRPFETVEAFYFRRRQLHPELLVAARIP